MKYLSLVGVGLSTFALLPCLTSAQSARVLLRDGEAILGAGAVSRLEYVAIDDNGTWLALVETDSLDNDRDLCLVRSGFLTLREGMALPLPSGSTLDDWRSLHGASNGDLGMVLQVRVGALRINGLYWNLGAVALHGDVLDVPPLPASATLQDVNVVRVTSDGTILALAKVRNPDVSPVANVDALLRFRVDGQGNVLQREVLATKGVVLGALGVPVDTLGALTAPEHSLGMNRTGDFILPVSGIGRRAMMKNLDTIVAEELTQSPVAGRTWGANAFALSKVAINDREDVVFTGMLTPIGGDPLEPTNFLIVKNGQKFAQSGDVLAALSPEPLAKAAPLVALSNRGSVFWRAQPIFSTAGGAAFMIDQTPLIQESVTIVEGHAVNTVAGGNDCFAVSPDGRFFVARVVLQNVGDAILYIDFGLVTELPGCRGLNQGTLRHVSGAPRVGQQIRVAMDEGPAPGADALLFLSSRTSLSASGCGVFTARGELLLAPPFTDVVHLPPWDGVNPTEHTFAVPNSLALVDATFYLQGLFGIPGRFRTYQLTNALEFELGPP